MIKTFIQSSKCENCNKVIGEEVHIVESKSMSGTYLTVCPHCMTELMTAGQNLIKMPKCTNSQIALKIRKELSDGLSEMAIKKVNESDYPKQTKKIIGDFLNALRESTSEMAKELNNKEQINIAEDNKKAIERDNTTTHVVLLDGDVYDEYTKEAPVKLMFTNMIKEFGEEAIINGDVKLYELKEIKPNFKKKITYVLDM